MIGIRHDLVDDESIYQGADWYKEFQLVNPDTDLPYNLSGFLISSKARKKATDTDAAFTFTCTVSDAAAGKIKLALTNVQTSAIAKPGGYTYDVEAKEVSTSLVSKVIIPSMVNVVAEYTK
jgi:hypothetical protein